jgi:single stranded DNA-binding protein
MFDLNTITISGYLAHDPKCRYRHSDIAITSLRMAVPQDATQGQCKVLMWLTVKLFGAAAELAAQDLTKGDGVSAIGRLSFETWVTKDGISRTTCVILADSYDKDCGSSRTEARDRAAQGASINLAA